MSILAAPPGDGISSLSFSPTAEELLLLSSWDCTTRLYDVSRNQLKNTYDFSGASLCCSFDCSGQQGYSGGLDEFIYALDFTRGVKYALGQHQAAVSSMHYNGTANCLFTGSWDRTVQVWDFRSPVPSLRLILAGKVFSLSCSNNRLVVATSARDLTVYDVRYLSGRTQPEQQRESPLRHQTRTVACDPVSNAVFAVGSTEGRCAVEYLDPGEDARSQGYAFKCHRQGDKAFPVNAIAFHPVFGSFATGGCDGVVNVWDGQNRKRLAQMPQYPTSVAALAFSASGAVLAVASSYTYERGDPSLNGEKPEDNVYLETITEGQAKPRVKTVAAAP